MAAADPEQGTGDEVTGRSWGQLRGPVESKVWNMVKTFAFTLRDLGRQVSFLNGLVVVNMSGRHGLEDFVLKYFFCCFVFNLFLIGG